MVEIEWAATAENDLLEIIDYIAQDSPQYAYYFSNNCKKKLKN